MKDRKQIDFGKSVDRAAYKSHLREEDARAELMDAVNKARFAWQEVDDLVRNLSDNPNQKALAEVKAAQQEAIKADEAVVRLNDKVNLLTEN